MQRLVDAVKNTRRDGPGAVACSGGPDSVALALAFVELNVPIALAHVNHQLRGEESDADEAFVKALAAKWGVPFHSTRIALPSANVEAAARKARYEWFATLGVNWIATGHTADDQAETILLRILHGTGLQGLQGIHEEIPQSPPIAVGGKVIRPLLRTTRSEVLEYLQSKDQSFRTDSSNSDPRFTRNRVRNEVIPLLKTINSDVVNAINRLAEQSVDAMDALSLEAEKLLIRAELPRAGSLVILDCAWFRLRLVETNQLCHPHVVREMFRVLWEREEWPRDRMTYHHWDSLCGLIANLDGFGDIDLPGGISGRRVGHVVQLGPRS